MKKKIAYLNNEIGDIAHKFSIQNKLKLMGSNSLRGILFPSDYDFVSKITEPMKALSNHLQELFSKPLPFLFLDFKAGSDPTKKDKKLRWTPEDLSKGYVIIHNQKKTLEDALKENMLIKLDYAVPIGNSFFENSILFITRHQSPKSKKEIEKELDNDITIYTKKENSMKALKRLYSLLLLQQTNEPLQKKLVDFFNSDIGLANKIANDLELLLLILEKHNLPFQQIVHTIQMIKERLSTIPWVNHLQLMNTMTKRNSKKIIEKEINYLRSKINPLAKSFLRVNMK
jgi:hypothetical protein